MFKQVALVALFAVVAYGFTENDFDSFGPGAERSRREGHLPATNDTNATDNNNTDTPADPTMEELIQKRCADAFPATKNRREAHKIPGCIEIANTQCNITAQRTRREGHTLCIDTAIEMAKEQLNKPKTTVAPAPKNETVTEAPKNETVPAATEAPNNVPAPAPAPEKNTTKPGSGSDTKQVVLKYTVELNGDLTNMTADEKKDLQGQLETEAKKGLVDGAVVEVGDFKQNLNRRRASHENGPTFSSIVTVKFPVGTTLEQAKALIKAQPTATLKYTIGGVAMETVIAFAELELTDVTPPPTSSAATVLSTVATVLIATVAALF